jgi:hypothetical protein
MKRSPAFRINEVYQSEVERLLNSRRRSKVIHGSGNIDASGDELEESFRDILRRRLPNKYFVGHGHVVDRELRVSPQFDIIIADNSATPILFEGENGTQYFPWESVYAIGEIKSTYAAGKRPIADFARKIKRVKQELEREPTPANYLGGNIFAGKGLAAESAHEVRDPLFQFVVFFDSGNFSDGGLIEEYSSIADQFLPIGAFFLDGHIVVKAEVRQEGKRYKIGKIDFDPVRMLERCDIEWVRLSYQHATDRGGQALAALMLALSSHLNNCLLMPPSVAEYLGSIMRESKYEAGFVTLERFIMLAQESGKRVPDGILGELKRRRSRLSPGAAKSKLGEAYARRTTRP